MNTIQKLHAENLKTDIPDFAVGDTLRVEVRIMEGGKERLQAFTGTVIARRGGGISESFVLRRVAFGQGVERLFPLHSPRLASLQVTRRGRVRRAKLYYVRDQVGKAARIKELQEEQA